MNMKKYLGREGESIDILRILALIENIWLLQNMSQTFKLKIKDETRNYLIEEIK